MMKNFRLSFDEPLVQNAPPLDKVLRRGPKNGPKVDSGMEMKVSGNLEAKGQDEGAKFFKRKIKNAGGYPNMSKELPVKPFAKAKDNDINV